MAATRSLVFGNLPLDISTPTLKKTAQEFARDDVLITPSLDFYAQIARAKEIVSSGKSLALESGALGAKQISKEVTGY
jgi:hypothetical protein